MFLLMFTYFLVPECIHQTDSLLHCQREGEVRSRVDLWHLNVLKAEVPLPLCFPTHLVLSEDVRDQISWKVKRRRREVEIFTEKQSEHMNPNFWSKWKSYVHCLMVWNCPWGTQENYKAVHRREMKVEVVVDLLIFLLFVPNIYMYKIN